MQWSLPLSLCRGAIEAVKRGGASTPLQLFTPPQVSPDGGVLSERSENLSQGTRAKASAILDQVRSHSPNALLSLALHVTSPFLRAHPCFAIVNLSAQSHHSVHAGPATAGNGASCRC